MSAIAAMLHELEHEAATTRRVLERIPDSKLTWKPHPKSMSLGQLGLHVAMGPGHVAEMSRQAVMELTVTEQPAASSNAEILAAHDAGIARAREILQGMKDSDLAKPFRIVAGAAEVATMPIGGMLRSGMLNHWYHHRGQLSVYLREVGAPVPSIYGPSADENPYASLQTAAAASA
ncbi:MAG: DinB family protein [Bryobacteraceae bacterium]